MKLRAEHRISRRSLLRVGLLGGVGASWADCLRWSAASEARGGPKPTADAVIFLHLSGGPAHLDTLDLKPDAPAEERGPFAAIDTKISGLKACEHLPRLAAAIDRFALLRGISHSVGDHLAANQFLLTGNKPNAALRFPAIGSVLTKERASADDMPTFVAVPSSDAAPGFLGVEFAPFKTTAVPTAGKPFGMRGLSLAEGMTVERYRKREVLRSDLDRGLRDARAVGDLLDGLDRFGQKATEMILSPSARQAFAVEQEPSAIAKLFQTDELGQSCLLATRLVERGVRCVTITHDGWDTHLNNFELLKTKLLPPLDGAAVALVEALRQKGLLERTLVVITGEFGRTPTINANQGRDHWPRTMWTLVAGGGTRAGALIGGTDPKGHGPDDGTKLKPDDLAASIYRALGIDHKLEYHTKTGRPVILVQNGEPIAELFA